jgi:hypothetical protein
VVVANAIAFDWQYQNPTRSIENYITILSGPTIVYAQADLDALFALRRPVSIRATGDPANGGRVYVDHFGPDPTALLLMYVGIANLTWSATPRHMQYHAILREIKRTQAMPGGFHFCNMEFVLMDAGTVIA